jgi:hypothetical protein
LFKFACKFARWLQIVINAEYKESEGGAERFPAFATATAIQGSWKSQETKTTQSVLGT